MLISPFYELRPWYASGIEVEGEPGDGRRLKDTDVGAPVAQRGNIADDLRYVASRQAQGGTVIATPLGVFRR